MRFISFIMFTMISGSPHVESDPVYVYSNFVDYMSMTIHEENKYELVISSCTFQVKCEGEFIAFGDSLVIKTKKIRESIEIDDKEVWKKTAFCKRIKKKYLNNFRYMIISDSTLKTNEVRWKNLTFKKK